MIKYNYLVLKQINEIVFIFGTDENLSKYKNIYYSKIEWINNVDAIVYISYSNKNLTYSFKVTVVDNIEAKTIQGQINFNKVNSMINNNIKKYKLSKDSFIELKK